MPLLIVMFSFDAMGLSDLLAYPAHGDGQKADEHYVRNDVLGHSQIKAGLRVGNGKRSSLPINLDTGICSEHAQ